MVLYDSLFSILNQYIYGSPDTLTAFQELTLVQLSTLGSVFICALPLVTVYWLFRFVSTLGNRW